MVFGVVPLIPNFGVFPECLPYYQCEVNSFYTFFLSILGKITTVFEVNVYIIENAVFEVT